MQGIGDELARMENAVDPLSDSPPTPASMPDKTSNSGTPPGNALGDAPTDGVAANVGEPERFKLLACFGSKRQRRLVVALLLLAVVVVVVAIVLGALAGTGTIGQEDSQPEPTQEPTTPPPPVRWVQMGQDLRGEAAGDQFGRSIALSADGTIVAAGARFNDGNGKQSGHVRVFEFDRSAIRWVQLGQDLDGKAERELFGWSVALSSSGTILAAGTPFNDRINGTNSGHVRLFAYNSTTKKWNQTGQDLYGEAPNDYFGYSVALSSDGAIAAAGSKWNDGAGNASGHVRVYALNQSVNYWEQLGKDIEGEEANDHFGDSVALSSNGRILAAGAPDHDGNGSKSGHVQLYKYDPNADDWNQLGNDLVGEAAGDQLGHSVALSADGMTVAAGAPQTYSAPGSGYVRLFAFNVSSNQWKQLGKDLDGETEKDRFGFSVALSSDGNMLAAGAYGNDDNGSESGQVRLFEFNRSTQQWNQADEDLDGEAAFDYFGYSVALSSDGAIVAAGAHGNNGGGENSGQVRVFED